jgi:type IV pilus assembly protein PilB
MNTELRELAFNRAPLSKVREVAVASGMRNLLGDGKLKILDGDTTLEEIARITQIEGVVDTDAESGDDEPLAA